MSASLLMSTAVVSSDGLTIVVGMSGVSGSLSPASGITGLLVGDTQNGAGRVVPTSAITSSGSTITITLAEIVNGPADDAVILALATAGGGSNLTDTGGNTPTGQNPFAVTANNSTWFAASAPTFAACSKIQGGVGLLIDPYQQAARWNSSDGYLEFNATCTSIDVNAFLFSSHYVLQQDGVDIHDWGVSSSGTVWAPLGVVSGLSGSHTYRVVQINSLGVPFQDQAIRSVRVIGTLGAAVTRKTVIVEIGDSYVQLGGNQAPADARTCHMWLSCDFQGIAEQHPGLSGAEVSGAGGIASFSASWVSTLGATPALAILRGGGNDLAAGVSNADFRAAWDTMIANVKGVAQPPTKIICMGILQGITGDFTAYNTQIQNAASAASVLFVDPTSWIGPTSGRQSDGIHLSEIGETIVGNRLIPIIAGQVVGASYSVSGPATGTVGSAATFTVTLPHHAVNIGNIAHFNGETMSLSDGGAGGTFTPSSATPSGVNSFTFTYRPASTGVKTISVSSNGVLWVDPASNSITVSAAPVSSGPPVFPRGIYVKGMGGA